MIPIVVYWTEYTATVNGRILKLVPCENCTTEYVYALEREGRGFGTSAYMLNEEGAQTHAESAAKDSLQSYLQNDFDPVPCPACGHYQRYMFPKLIETKSLASLVAMLAVLIIGCLDGLAALKWSIDYLQEPSDRAFERMVVTWSIFLPLCCIGFAMVLLQKNRDRRFDPNVEDRQDRIAKGRSRAITRVEFEIAQQRAREAGTGE